MANERTYPILPCRDLDPAIEFYETLGFKRTYRQLRPYPCAVVAREDFHVHLFGMPEFDPEQSYGSVIVCVPDPDDLYRAFAAGLRSKYGKLPVSGLPRITRPRKKYGTVRGFSVVDLGGNWLRIYKLGASDADEAEESSSGLTKILEVATRLGDAKGDEAQALKTLENGLKRYADASGIDCAAALLYRAELAVRLGNQPLAQSSIAAVQALELDDAARESIAEELARMIELAVD